MKKWEDKRSILKIATLYYSEGLTQAEIAKKMEISRPLVSKILQEAKNTGIVEIYIKDEDAYSIALGMEIEKKYGLTEVIIVPNQKSATEAISKKNVGRAAASYLSSILPKVKKIGVSWGTTLAEFVDEMPFLQYPNVTVIPIMGGVGYSNVLYHSNHLAFLLAQKLNTNSTYFYAPALADTKKLKESLLESKMISVALSEGKDVDVAIVGVGNPVRSSTYRDLGYFTNSDIKELEEKGAIGDVAATFFDKDGQPVDTDVSSRMMGIELEDLKNVPCVIALATGKEKSDSLKALLAQQVIDVLIIDQTSADEL
ncbi:MAG: sugar-binding transcriptional regulator [Carnobacterium sp.]|uniref:sugar-binding transcriptional regulator n=1 Tax=Carnobacterium sp. TaxID=48221 RepID=UPI0033160295